MKNLIILLFFFASSVLTAQQKNSPYLSVASKDAVIPLKASAADVQISGTVAHVRITQTYHNQGATPIEAKYVFPMAVKAAVHKMQMEIGDRIVNAKIFEKQQAEKVYNDAVKKGKRAAKLDQERPNVFQMKVGNIMPNDEVTISIYYTEQLTPVNGNYQFVAPGVVGPRFTGEQQANETVFHTPYTPKGVADTFDYDLMVNINAGIPIKNVASTTHKINVNYTHLKTAEVFLSKSNTNPANRDFILNYSLRGDEIQSGVLLYEHEDENYFALLMEPTEQVLPEAIPPREYHFIVDVSGSMNGYPLEVSKTLMRNLLCDLRTTDVFNAQLFASSSTIFRSKPVPAYTENIEAAIRFLSQSRGGGGTQLLSALKEAYQMPRSAMGSARSMVVITDGYVSIEKEAFNLIQEHLDEANVFTFGIGSSVNRYLIEGMAKVANSESFIATTMGEASQVARNFKNYIATPLLTQVKLKQEGFEMYDLSVQSIPDVFAARPIVVYGKYRGKPEGKLILTGYQGGKELKQEYHITKQDVSIKNKALRYLWAREEIAKLDDYYSVFHEDVKERVTDLGLKYNLATKYTSFVAVDEQQVNKDGTLKQIKQPLPLPQHVENTAVGAEASVTTKRHYKASFALDIITENTLSKTEKRQVMLWTKAVYTQLINKYLKQYTQLRISVNSEGKVATVAYWKNGSWVIDQGMTAAFTQLRTQALSVQKALRITIKR